MKRVARNFNGYYSDPAIDGDTIVFVCDNALWEVPRMGGFAKRQTPRLANISTPILNIQKNLVAFAAAQYGPPQVCVLDRARKTIRELTRFPESCRVLSWAADGGLIFTSSTSSPFRQVVCGWKADLVTARVERLSSIPIGWYSRSPSGTIVVSPPAVDPRSWRGYRGGARGEILIDRAGNGTFERLQPVDGNLAFPVICNGRIYFVTGTDDHLNLFSCTFEGTDVRQHTNYKEFAPHSLATDGQYIVYSMGGDLYLFEPISQPVRVPIVLSEPVLGKRSVALPLCNGMQSFDGAGTHEPVAFCSFGSVFQVLPSGPVRIGVSGHCSAVRYLTRRDLVVMVRGRDRDRLTIVRTDGRKKRKIVPKTSVGRILSSAVVSSGLSIILTNHRFELLALDVETGRCVRLDKSRHRAINQLSVSPDGRLCAYTFPMGLHRTVVRIAATDGSGIVAETDPAFADFSPYFLSNESVVFLSHEVTADERETGCTSIIIMRYLNGRELQVGATSPAESRFHFERLPGPEESYSHVISFGERTLLLNRAMNPNFPEEPLIELISSSQSKFRVWCVGGDAVFKDGPDGFIVQVGSKLYRGEYRDEALKLNGPLFQFEDFAVRVRPATLWNAALHEAWRLAREELPAPQIQASRWLHLLAPYSTLMKKACTSRDAIKIMAEMLGHLRMSHAQVVSPALPEPRREGLLGADIAFDSTSGAWRIHTIPRVDARSSMPLALANPLLDVREGDLLIALDDQFLTAEFTPADWLVDKVRVPVRCRLLRKDEAFREVTVETLGTERPLRYANWVFERRQFVADATRGKVTYLHLPDVSERTRMTIERWLIYGQSTPGIIIDVRFNEGGPLGFEIAEAIARRPIGVIKTRWSCELEIPEGSRERTIVILTNRFTSSGGELLACVMRARWKAKIVGEDTFGGGFGNASRRTLPDGSILTLPELSVTWPEEGSSIENRGVIPDELTRPGYEMDMPDPAVVLALREFGHSEDRSKSAGSQ